MKTIDFGDSSDPAAVAAFWRAYQGKRQPRQRKPTTTTRAARGEGGRERDLMTLARHGWTVTHQQHGAFWLSNPQSGAETSRRSTYREALDAALAELIAD